MFGLNSPNLVSTHASCCRAWWRDVIVSTSRNIAIITSSSDHIKNDSGLWPGTSLIFPAAWSSEEGMCLDLFSDSDDGNPPVQRSVSHLFSLHQLCPPCIILYPLLTLLNTTDRLELTSSRSVLSPSRCRFKFQLAILDVILSTFPSAPVLTRPCSLRALYGDWRAVYWC